MSSRSASHAFELDFPIQPYLVPRRPTAILLSLNLDQPAPAGPLALRSVDGGSARQLLSFGPLPRTGPNRESACGFLVVLLLTPDSPGEVAIELTGSLPDGGAVRLQLPPIPVASLPLPLRRSLSMPAKAELWLCMATYEPDLQLFRRQVDSIRNQDYADWVCIVADDASSPRTVDAMRDILTSDGRFILLTSPVRRGFYRNFEHALAHVPESARYVALADQDDVWYPTKLSTLIDALEESGAYLAYSDQRLTTVDGTVLSTTLWHGRRNEYRKLSCILCANTITGASMLFRRGILDLVLPFPETPGFQFHDHWIAAVAVATGQVTYVDKPLYDYVQHSAAVLGHVAVQRRRLSWSRADIRRRRLANMYYGYLPAVVRALTVKARLRSLGFAVPERDIDRILTLHSARVERLRLATSGIISRVFRESTLGTELTLVSGARQLARAMRTARGSPGSVRRTRPVDVPPLDSFEQPSLRRWRARLSSPRR